MKIVVSQGGGPITALGFDGNGRTASLGAAPVVSDTQVEDLLLIQRAGMLQKMPLSVALGDNPPATEYGAGPPAAGSGGNGQTYVDRSGLAQWVNVGGTWFQVGFFAAPTAPPIPPTSAVTPAMNFSKASNARYVAALA